MKCTSRNSDSLHHLLHQDYEKSLELRQNVSSGPKLPYVDHVAWWRIGDRVAAYSEGVKGDCHL